MIKPTKDKHTYKVIWSKEDKEYVGLCAELPSLSWLAPTSKEALQGIKKIVAEIKQGLDEAKQGKVSRINLSDL